MDDRTDQAVRHATEEADHFARDFTERAERAAQANVIANQAETLQHMWQAGVDVVSSATARSVDQAARTLGMGCDEAEQAASQASGNVSALVQSASVWADTVRAISTELVDLARHSTEHSIDHAGAMMRCRSPQDFVQAQSDAMRDNLEMLMDSSRRMAEIAMRTSEESSYVVGRNLKPIKPAG